MLHVTPRATQHLQRLRDERRADGVPRLVGNGALVGFTFAAQPARGDRRIDAGGMPIFVAPGLADALDQSILDARTDDGFDSRQGETLVVRLRPGATLGRAMED